MVAIGTLRKSLPVGILFATAGAIPFALITTLLAAVSGDIPGLGELLGGVLFLAAGAALVSFFFAGTYGVTIYLVAAKLGVVSAATLLVFGVLGGIGVGWLWTHPEDFADNLLLFIHAGAWAGIGFWYGAERR